MANILAIQTIPVYSPEVNEMLGEKVRSVWADVQNMTGTSSLLEDEDTEVAEPNSSLFQCSECDVVYIALEKDRCSSCREEVTEVSPTLSRA